MRRIYLLILFVLCLSRAGQAEENNPFTVNGTYTWNNKILTITSDATVKNTDPATATDACIIINGGTEETPLNITLDGININRMSVYWQAAFALAANSHARLILKGSNTVIGCNVYAGLRVPETAVVEITAESDKGNDLTAKCVNYSGAAGAGIGGNRNENTGKIIICGGTVTASSESTGAGIGGGASGCGDVLIKGGDITATSQSGAGIGNGHNSTGGTIVISGGKVKAEGKIGSAGIGAGDSGNDKNSTCGSITITGGIIEAQGGESASGIGNGLWRNDVVTSFQGQVTITGGEIKSKGGVYSSSDIGRGGLFSSNQKSDIKDLIIGPDATLKDAPRIQPDHYNGFVFQDGSATVCGEIELPVDITLDKGETLIIPDDAKLVVPSGKSLIFNEGATLTVEENGGLANEGSLQVNGEITGSGTISGPVSNKENETVFSVSFDLNGATGDFPVQLIKSGEKATAPTPVREYYTLEGWYDTKELTGGTAIGEKTITAATKFYARWSANNFTVTASSEVVGTYGSELANDLAVLITTDAGKPCGTISFSLKGGNLHPLNLSLATDGRVTGAPDAATDTGTGTSVIYVATAANHVSHDITVVYKIGKRRLSITPRAGQKLYEDEAPEYAVVANILATDEPLNDGKLAKDGTHITQGTLDLTDEGKAKYTLDFTADVEYSPLAGKVAEVEAIVPAANIGNWHKENIVLTAPEGFGISLQQPVPFSSGETGKLPATLIWKEEGLDRTISYILTRTTTGVTYNHSVSVCLDKTPPKLAVDANFLSYTLTAVDGLSGVKKVTIDGVEVSLPDGTYSASSFSGSHTAIATDNAGNTTTVSFVLENYFEAENEDGVTICYYITKAGPDGNELRVAQCQYTGVVNIPDEVTKDGITYKVTTIGNNAFENCTGLTSVTMGDNVTSIGLFAFSGCTNLPSVTIGNGVTSIDKLAFSVCTALTSVILGEKVVSIGGDAFYGSPLTEINIPASVSEMGRLFDLPTLKRISVAVGNRSYSSSDGILYSGDGKKLIRCPQQIGKTSIKIPDKVTAIGDRAFKSCTGLTSITVGKNVTTIEGDAFEDIPLTEINIPASVSDIAAGVFNIPTLKRISVAAGNRNYSSSGGALYSGDGKILIRCPQRIEKTSMKIPDEVITIKYGAFSDCTGLTSVTIGKNVTEIEDYAFQNTSLTEINIPASVSSISSYALNIPALKRISVAAGNQSYSSFGGILYNKDGTTLIMCPQQIENGSITIPDGVTRIASRAFWDCTGLLSVTLGKSFNAIIEDNAFERCYSLREIYNYSTLSLTAGDSGNGGITCYAKVIHTKEEESCIKEQGDYRYIVYTESSGQKVELLKYTGTATALALPESLPGISSYTIADHLFYNKNDITSVFIPEAVTAIGTGAFAFCTGLESLISLAKTPPATDGTFYDLPATTTVYVPAGSIDSYQKADGWGSFSNIRDIGPFSISITLNDPEMGSVDISSTPAPVDGKYYGGTPLTLRARPNSGYHFTGWSDDVADATRTITVDKDLTLQANFAVDYVPPAQDPIYYSVFLPEVEGAVTDPSSGEFQVEAWDNFRFYLTLDEEYNQSNPVVTTDRGETITPRSSDGAYIIKYISSDVNIYIEGIEKKLAPVANETIENIHSRVWAVAGTLHVLPAFDGKLFVYSAAGTLKVFRDVHVGEELTFRLPEGVYVVRLGNKGVKVVL